MSLPRNLASKFARITKSEKQTNKETTVYGTIKEHNGSKYVLLDGAEILTPVMTTVDFEDGERVTVLLKNHTATVTGNISSPASRYSSVKKLEEQVKDNATLITNSKVYQGTTNPKDPIKGETLWIDTSSNPPLLKQFTFEGKWVVVGTNSLKTGYILILNDKIDIGSGGSVNIRAGANFTVDATNLDISAEGVIYAKKAELTDATVSGNILVDGNPVLHSGNIVIGSTAPVNPSVGTIWINPSNSILQGTYAVEIQSNDYSLDNNGGYLHRTLYGSGMGSLNGSYIYTYTINIPVYSHNNYGPHRIVAAIWRNIDGSNQTIEFPSQTINSAGLTWYRQSITVSKPWFGAYTDIKLQLFAVTDLDFGVSTGGDIVIKEGSYASTLTVTATPTSTTGWQNATVKYFAG